MSYSAPAATGVGHVHLRVADLDRALGFYRDIMGFELQARMKDAAFLGAGGYHHHIGLNTWDSAGGPPPRGHSGLFHTAFLYPTLDDLKDIARRVREAGVTIYGHADHGVSVALYFDDPDGNGVEICWDKPREDWPRNADGTLALTNDRFDLGEFLAA